MHKKTLKSTAFLIPVLVCAGICSCSIDEDRLRSSDTVTVGGREVPSSVFEPGAAVVQLTEDLLSQLDLQTDSSGQSVTTGVKSVDNAFASLGVTSMRPLFDCNDRFAPRKRKMGMHLWYVLEFDKSTALTRVSEDLSSIDGVQTVEFTRQIHRPEYTIREVEVPAPGTATQSAITVFNDPMLGQQWHYYNDGHLPKSNSGADINVLPAWERGFVGNEEVIVAVVDGGVDYTHADLADNMWVGPDGHSFGFNFVRNTSEVTADDHGTHVAGTVAAVNNNGIGVAGVAGGDAAAGIKGVRIMSCQIFEGEYGASDPQMAKVYEWSADNGAVISQNSWGYDQKKNQISDTPQFLKAAIDYFIEMAGMDETGTYQVGPMAGGLVVFAAGNDEKPTGYPGSYEPTLAVSAIAADYSYAYYTNYGSWVDICAPGGDVYDGPQVLSTLPGNRYGEMQGTSMACPHVSGVAALLLSAAGGSGFTSAQLRDMLENSARDISAYLPKDYMGHGLVDVGAALSMLSTVAPEPVDDFEVSSRSNFIDFNFTVPLDEDNGTPGTAIVFYSTEQFDIEDAEALRDIPQYSFSISGKKEGDPIEGSISGLDFETMYYVSVATEDFARNRSALSPLLTVTTGVNSSPVFIPDTPVDTTLKQPGTMTMDFHVEDPDGHTIIPTVEGASGVSATLVDPNTIRVLISSQAIGEGTHEISIVASDGYDRAVRIINLEVEGNTAPEKTGDPEDVIIGLGGSSSSIEIDLKEYISDPDGDVLTYRTSFSVNGIVSATVNSSGIMTITPQSQGVTELTVTALDPLYESVSVTFSVLVRDGTRPADFYPNPVVDVLNIRTGENASDAEVSVRSASGSEVLSEEFGNLTPFEPAALDMSSLTGGIYTVVLKYTTEDGTTQTITNEIAKL